MSGLACLIKDRDQPVGDEVISAVTTALVPFGRDGTETRIQDTSACFCSHDFNTAENAKREQPLVIAGGTLTFMFDGRLDNRPYLARLLDISAPDLGAMSDAALAGCCWERFGVQSAQHWCGEFACIVWNNDQRRLYALCDPMGKRCLVYARTEQGFAIASAAMVLQAIPGVTKTIDYDTLALRLSQIWENDGATLFQDIRNLPAGSILERREADLKITPYFDFDSLLGTVRYTSDDDYVAHFNELFGEIVTQNLRTNGKVGSFMSGGYDSSTMAIFASDILERQGKRLPTFTSVPGPDWDGIQGPNWYADETPYVTALAKDYPNIDLNLVDAVDTSIFDYENDLIRYSGGFMRNVLNGTWIHGILNAARQQGVTTMLDGSMGNATLSYAGDECNYQLLRHREYRALVRSIIAGLRNGNSLRRELAPLVRKSLPAGAERVIRHLRKERQPEQMFNFMSPLLPSSSVYNGSEQRLMSSWFSTLQIPSAVGREIWLLMLAQHSVSSGELHQGCRAVHNVETRDPFADMRLMKWCFSIPLDQYYQNGQPRALFRRVMQDRLPPVFFNRPIRKNRQTADWQSRLRKVAPQILENLDRYADDPDLADLIDFERLEKSFRSMPELSDHDTTKSEVYDRMLLLPFTLQAARFVKLAKGGN